jgi:hypothetical protein
VIRKLRMMRPLKPLLEEISVDVIAYSHARYMGLVSGKLDHSESQSSGDVMSRIKKFGKFKAVSENLAFDKTGNLRHVLFMWLVDDGIGSRGHQTNILDENMTHAGVGVFRAEDGPKSGFFVVYNAVRDWKCKKLCNSISISDIKEARIEGSGAYNQEDISQQSSFGNDLKKQAAIESPKRRAHFSNDQKSSAGSIISTSHIDSKNFLKIPKVIMGNTRATKQAEAATMSKIEETAKAT